MKILITGTFCSGKTSLCIELNKKMDNSILLEEPARELITNLPDLDWSKSFIREYLIVRQILIEKNAQLKNNKIIVDAGVESNIAHDILLNSDSSKHSYLEDLKHDKYDYVFFCNHEEVEFISDGFRMQNLQLRNKLSITIKEVLKSLQYTPITVFGNVSNRVDQILQHIESTNPHL